MRAHTPRPRQFVNAQDITSELAIFSGKSPNGSRPKSVTEMMRQSLPTPSTGRSAIDIFAEGGSEALADAVRDQEARDRDHNERTQREADEQYQRFLDGRQSNNDEEVIEIDDNGRVIDPVDQRPRGRELSNDDAVAAIYAEADRAAARIRQNSRRSTPVTPLVQPPSEPAQAASPVQMRAIDTPDIDNLWDWLRHDPNPTGVMFFKKFGTSRDLHDYVESYSKHIRAIDAMSNGRYTHIGFFVLFPVDTSSQTAMLHVYLAPSVRGHFDKIFPYVLTGSRQLIPPTMNLVIHPGHNDVNAFGRLVAPYQFTAETMFVQPGVR